MSRHPRVAQPASSVTARLVSVAAEVGASVRAARLRRRWTTGRLASEAGTSRTLVYLVERGEPTTLQTYARLATALGLRLEVDLCDPRQRHVPPRAEDPVHAAIVDGLAARYASQGRLVAVDEPYQHFQFAGRADLAVVDSAGPALLHHEVKTAIPNVGEMAGSWNAKRRYLAMVLAERHGLRGGFRSVAHVLTLAWTADCLHVIRLRGATLRALGPDGARGVRSMVGRRAASAGRERDRRASRPARKTAGSGLGGHRRPRAPAPQAPHLCGPAGGAPAGRSEVTAAAGRIARARAVQGGPLAGLQIH